MKKINLGITGCMGRMGQQLIRSTKQNRDFKLTALTESKKVSKKLSGIQLTLNSEKAFKSSNVIIDFTVPKCTLEVLKIAVKQKKKVVIGTSGFSKKEENLIKKFSEHEFTLYEKEESLSLDEGYGIQLSVNGVKILNKIGFKKVTVMGSIGCKIASILRGECDIYISLSLPGKSSPKDWDFAAPEAILKAAGGAITNLNNEELNEEFMSMLSDANISGLRGTLLLFLYSKCI